jgi:hypothetical protein
MRVSSTDEALDLAMLEIPVGGTRAVSVSSSSRRGGQQGVVLHEGQRRHGLERFVEPGDIQAFLEEIPDYPPNLCDPSV